MKYLFCCIICKPTLEYNYIINFMEEITCIIAAGGLGKRLQGFRNNDKTKVLLEVNGTPMINQQITQILSWGIKKFVVITNPLFDKLTQEVTKKSFPDLDIKYAIQEEPLGISHALSKAEKFLTGSEISLFVLGDNFFGENPIKNINFDQINQFGGCHVFTIEVNNPQEFGVLVLDQNGKIDAIEEKPEKPKSNKAVVGVYIFDNKVISNIKKLTPSSRGEYEVTDLINIYINNNIASFSELNSWWIDAGTPDRILELEDKLAKGI